MSPQTFPNRLPALESLSGRSPLKKSPSAKDKFWWSAEIQADISDLYCEAIAEINKALNRLLVDVSLGPKIEQWVFIAIIRAEDHPSYDEVVRKSSRGKILEFRLKISHRDFGPASRNGRIRLILAALSRSVGLMETLGVPAETQDVLLEVLSRVENELIREKSKNDLPLQ